jgi:hypothetical protein
MPLRVEHGSLIVRTHGREAAGQDRHGAKLTIAADVPGQERPLATVRSWHIKRASSLPASIQRTADAHPRLGHDVRVDHGGPDVLVA